jgi:hypothetical protein
METITEDKAIYKTINEKMGETVSLSVEKLHLSEYNTRSTCIDLKHVDYLAERIRERGFHPKRAISVNVITGAGGAETTYRVAAGIHRLEAARKARLSELPCLLYYNLTEEEECLLDKWDNEMDEDHKPIHFLEEAEHYRYLKEVKGWSVRQIAKNKGTNKSIVGYRLQIANIPEEAKKIIGELSTRVDSFYEGYFRDICKLSKPHITAICEEIAARRELAERGEKDQWGRPVVSMKQTEIKKRTDELLRLEKDGKALTKVKEPAPTQMTLFDNEDTEEEQYIEKTVLVETAKGDETAEEEIPARQAPKVHPELDLDMLYRSPDKNSRGLNLDRCVRWLKMAGLVRELGQTTYIVLRKIEEYDLWYRPNQDEPFFFGKSIDPFALIGEQSGVEKEHLQKRSLPILKREGFINYWMENGIYWFKLDWDKLMEIYRKKAYGIPFSEDGLQDIPPNFSGVIRPTPFHYIRIERGTVVTWNGDAAGAVARAQEHGTKEDDTLSQTLRALKPPMGEKEIAFCRDRRPETEIALKLLGELGPRRKKEIRNEAAYVLELVRKGPGVPQDFVSPEETRKKEEHKEKLEAFLKELSEKSFRYFCPKDDLTYDIVAKDEHGFTIEKDTEGISYCYFKDWMDIKYFR